MSLVMQYLSELVHAQLEYKKPGIIPEGISVNELEAIAHAGHMDYLILGGLLRTDLFEEDKTRIRTYVMRSTVKTLAQVCCLKELDERLEENEIYHLVLKGSVLKSLYPSPEMREMSDIDVMIYDTNLDRAKKVVEGMGFRLFKSVKHHDIYMKSPFLVIELHHALFDMNVDKNLFEYFQKEKRASTMDGQRYALQFSIEDFYVYLIAHMAKHFYETGCGIRNVLDVYCYCRAYESTWNKELITIELNKCGLSTFEKRIRTLAQVWLGGQNPDSFSLSLFDYMINCGIYGKEGNGVWSQLAKENKSDRANIQAYAKRWYYFPPLSYMENDYPWLKKHPYFLFVAWVIRAVHGLVSKEGREKRKMLLKMKNEEVCTINDLYKGMQLHIKK